jgi:hypothetical protein
MLLTWLTAGRLCRVQKILHLNINTIQKELWIRIHTEEGMLLSWLTAGRLGKVQKILHLNINKQSIRVVVDSDPRRGRDAHPAAGCRPPRQSPENLAPKH